MGRFLLLALAVLVVMCGGCRFPSERAVYKVAREAVSADPDLPSGARLYPIGKAKLNVAKNAARCELPYEYVNAAGETVTDSYVVWAKRIARRWELDRYYRTPTYPVGPEGGTPGQPDDSGQ